ncbi:MAG: hypothetical protein ATN35_07330 [Epulopiscium sp. Nele67-Bin004]|nr:MAG: hypothetical protein ATN35_07330 [Epulopiscium sp. Nele67-Bin004]
MIAKNLLLLTLSVVLSGCGTQELEVEQDEIHSISGFIYIENNVVYIDEIEVFTKENISENLSRIEEVGLTENDVLYPTGYYLYNENDIISTLVLTNDTIYEFIDFHVLYVDEEQVPTRAYSTNNVEEFVEGSCYYDQPLEVEAVRVPYFIDYNNKGEIIKIFEEFGFTI